MFVSDAGEEGTDIAGNYAKDFVDKSIDMFNKNDLTGEGSAIMLTNNEIKDIILVIRYLENTGILLKEATENITTQEG